MPKNRIPQTPYQTKSKQKKIQLTKSKQKLQDSTHSQPPFNAFPIPHPPISSPLPPMKRKKQTTFSNFDFDRANPTAFPPRLSTQATHSDTSMAISAADLHLSVTNYGHGYRCCKCTHGVGTGSWWWQATIDPQATGHFRIGWSQILGEVHAPVGFDEYSYAWRSVDGAIYHCSRPMAYSKPWGPGDTIGCRIDIPDDKQFQDFYSTQEHSELLGKVQEKWPPLKEGVYDIKMDILPGSSITFYLNGESMGVAFRDLYRAKYYPAVSIWRGGPVRVDFEGGVPEYLLAEGVLSVCHYKKDVLEEGGKETSETQGEESVQSESNNLNISQSNDMQVDMSDINQPSSISNQSGSISCDINQSSSVSNQPSPTSCQSNSILCHAGSSSNQPSCQSSFNFQSNETSRPIADSFPPSQSIQPFSLPLPTL